MKFGTLIRQRREELGLSLRNFYDEVGVDPSNWAKIERGWKPPHEMDKIDRVLGGLRLDDATYANWRDLARTERGELPDDLMESKDLLPDFYRISRAAAKNPQILDQLKTLV